MARHGTDTLAITVCSMPFTVMTNHRTQASGEIPYPPCFWNETAALKKLLLFRQNTNSSRALVNEGFGVRWRVTHVEAVWRIAVVSHCETMLCPNDFPVAKICLMIFCLWCSNSFIMLIRKAVSLIRHCMNTSVLQCFLIMLEEDLKAPSNFAAL